MNTTFTVLLSVAGSSGFVAVVGFFASKRKNKADTADTLVATAERLMGNYKSDNEQLRQEVAEIRHDRDRLADKVEILEKQIQRMAHALKRVGVDPDLAAEGEWDR